MNYTDDNKQTSFERARTPENQDKDPGVQGIGIRRFFEIVTPAVERLTSSATVVAGLEKRSQLQAKTVVDDKYKEWLASQAPVSEGPADLEAARRAVLAVDQASAETKEPVPVAAASDSSEPQPAKFFDPETSEHLDFKEIYRYIEEARQEDNSHA